MKCECEDEDTEDDVGTEMVNGKITSHEYDEVEISFDEVCCECGKLKKKHKNVPYKCMRDI